MSWPASIHREHLRAHVLAGGSPKEFSFSHGIGKAGTAKLIHRLGFRRCYLTADEACDVMRARAARAARMSGASA